MQRSTIAKYNKDAFIDMLYNATFNFSIPLYNYIELKYFLSMTKKITSILIVLMLHNLQLFEKKNSISGKKMK